MPQGAVTQIGFLIFFIVIMYLLLIRPQKKKEREIQAMRSNLMVGDEIVTIGGICGRIIKTREETIVIQVGADKVKFEMMRWGVSKVVESTSRPTSAKKSRPIEEDDDDDEIVEVKKMPKKMKKAASEDSDAGTKASPTTEDDD
jgi:preprotein translocase subunit YajC